MNKELLDKWLNGTVSAEELQQLKAFPEFSTYILIDAYTKGIVLPNRSIDNDLENLKKKISAKKQPIKVRKLHVLIKIAAVLVFVFASYIFISLQPTSISTKISQSEYFELPDQTSVILNEESTLSFNENNWQKERSLFMDGEAYFNVSKGKVFDVHTEQGTISVIGTQFNVLSRESIFRVSCFEGVVSVVHKNSTVKLHKGQTAILVNEELIMESIFISKPRWIGNESSFDNILITDVLNEVERIYSLEVSTQNIDVNLRFTGSFTHDNLETALQTVTLPLELLYHIESKGSVIISTKETIN